MSDQPALQPNHCAAHCGVLAALLRAERAGELTPEACEVYAQAIEDVLKEHDRLRDHLRAIAKNPGNWSGGMILRLIGEVPPTSNEEGR